MGRKKSGILAILKKLRGSNHAAAAGAAGGSTGSPVTPGSSGSGSGSGSAGVGFAFGLGFGGGPSASQESEEVLLEEELAHELAVAFDLYSKGLSSIPCREIGYILRSLGQNPTENDIINLVCEAGCSWDGYLTRQDFVSVGLVAMEKQANRLDDVKAAFRAFDHNNDGSISRDELREAMTRYGHTFSVAECDEMFQEADVNGDGQIDFQEFVTMMMQENVNYAANSPPSS